MLLTGCLLLFFNKLNIIASDSLILIQLYVNAMTFQISNCKMAYILYIRCIRYKITYMTSTVSTILVNVASILLYHVILYSQRNSMQHVLHLSHPSLRPRNTLLLLGQFFFFIGGNFAQNSASDFWTGKHLNDTCTINYTLGKNN